MQALIDSFLRHCPEDSARAYQHLKSLYTVLDDSVERVKSSMNAVIDRREFDKMDEFQSLLRAIDEGQQKLGLYIELLRQGNQQANRKPDKRPTAVSMALTSKEPRQRGIAVRINGTLVNAPTVKKLFEGVLGELDAKGQLELLLPLLPFASGTKRYLLAWKPLHPNGKSFFAPMEYEGMFIETNTSYRGAISSLHKLLSTIGVSFEEVS